MKTPQYVVILAAAIALAILAFTFLSYVEKPTGPLDEVIIGGFAALATLARPILTNGGAK